MIMGEESIDLSLVLADLHVAENSHFQDPLRQSSVYLYQAANWPLGSAKDY